MKNDVSLAVYLRHSSDVMNLLERTGMFGGVKVFGCCAENPLLDRRSRYGKRVNYVYAKKYAAPEDLKTEDEEWYSLCEMDKFSSIYCANFMVFSQRFCGSEDMWQKVMCEMEHRRWNMAMLLMGYKYVDVAKRDKRWYVHPDIVPFECLSEEEQNKDRDLIDARSEILR